MLWPVVLSNNNTARYYIAYPIIIQLITFVISFLFLREKVHFNYFNLILIALNLKKIFQNENNIP